MKSLSFWIVALARGSYWRKRSPRNKIVLSTRVKFRLSLTWEIWKQWNHQIERLIHRLHQWRLRVINRTFISWKYWSKLLHIIHEIWIHRVLECRRKIYRKWNRKIYIEKHLILRFKRKIWCHSIFEKCSNRLLGFKNILWIFTKKN